MAETRKDVEKRRIGRQLKQTAAERYADHQQDIGVLLDLVAEELRVHAERAAEDPKDWGYAGDLGRVRETLKGLLESLLIGRYEWSETEASRFIEDHLENMRGE
jgi:hypothetical protein